jgi:hypothetical protein
MSDLRERLQELAAAAAQQGRTAGPQAARRRGRRRRLRVAGGSAAAMVLVLAAAAVGADRLADRPATVSPPPTTRPSLLPSVTTTPAPSPTASTRPKARRGPPRIERPAGAPPGAIGAGMVRDVASELARCKGGDPDGPIVLVAWGKQHNRTWLILAKPPLPGEDWLCWANGLFEASGAGGLGNNGGPSFPLKPVQASGAGDIPSEGQYWGQVIGPVTKRASRVRVAFRAGIGPLDLVPIQADDRFPVNFYVGFYRQPKKDTLLEGFVATVTAYDRTGGIVGECQATPGPGHSC